MLNLLRMRCAAFLRNESGAAMFLVGLGLMTMVTATGAAIDYGRASKLQAKLSTALDAAGLAAAQVVNTKDVTGEVNKYFQANLPSEFEQSIVGNPTITVSDDKKVITLSVSAEVPTVFMRMVRINTISVSAVTEVTRADKALELVLVLDTTGSMTGSVTSASGASSTRIAELRTSAKKLIDIIFGNRDELQTLWVGIVPYVTSVNIGKTRTGWVKSYNASTLYPSGYPSAKDKWKGCVEERANGGDMTDEAPDPTKPETLWNIYYWADHANDTTKPNVTGPNNPKSAFWADNNWHIQTNNTFSIKDGDSLVDGNAARGPNLGCGQEMTFFLSKREDIKAKIDLLRPWSRSGTMSNVGMVWGWRMLSDKWQGKWDLSNPGLPHAYTNTSIQKAVVMMTDGENQAYSLFSDGGSNADNVKYSDIAKISTTDQYDATKWLDYTPYGRIQDGGLGATNKTPDAARIEINKRMKTICERMKQLNITIYTITFGVNTTTTSGKETKALFEGCATKPEYYFNTPDGAALSNAFKTIGDSLSNLRISK